MTEDALDDAVTACPRCATEEAASPHLCPYRIELEDDYETECECCQRCRTECAEDV